MMGDDDQREKRRRRRHLKSEQGETATHYTGLPVAKRPTLRGQLNTNKMFNLLTECLIATDYLPYHEVTFGSPTRRLQTAVGRGL